MRIDRHGDLLGAYEGLGYSRSPAVSPDGSRLASMGIRVHDGERVINVAMVTGRPGRPTAGN